MSCRICRSKYIRILSHQIMAPEELSTSAPLGSAPSGLVVRKPSEIPVAEVRPWATSVPWSVSVFFHDKSAMGCK